MKQEKVEKKKYLPQFKGVILSKERMVRWWSDPGTDSPIQGSAVQSRDVQSDPGMGCRSRRPMPRSGFKF